MIGKAALVCHSGGMDSSLCLALAIREFGAEHVLSLSFNYGQRHTVEIAQAAKICQDWHVDHRIVTIDFLSKLTCNALTNSAIPITHKKDQPPNTLVMGRNGLMARLGAIHAQQLGAHYLYMGVLGLEGANSGYRDCSRSYMDLKQQILRLDLDDPLFEIRTPLIEMTKKETMQLADQLGLFDYLITHTISCYEGKSHPGCEKCPACLLRNEGISQFLCEKVL